MNNSYFYTETAFHHQGDMDFMKGLIDATTACGASGVKFQVMTRTSDFISTKHKAYADLNGYSFSVAQWKEIMAYTVSKKLDIVMMPLNIGAFELTKCFNIKFLDIHSVSFYDEQLLQEVKRSGLDVILGAGGRTLAEIQEKKQFLGEKLKVLMTGFQSFPSKIEDVKIGKIAFLKEMFPELLIGYADHSAYDNEFAVKSNEYARLLGASVFEKHITTTEGVERVDFSAAVSEEKIAEIIKKINFIDEFILTDMDKSFAFTAAEETYRDRQLRCVANSDLPEGTVFTADMIAIKLVDDQSGTFNRIEQLVGKKINKSLEKDQSIRTTDIA